MTSLMVLIATLAACEQTPLGPIRSPDESTRCGLDARPQDPAQAVSAAVVSQNPGPENASPLRGFQCTKTLAGSKSPQGPLTIHFRPEGATDFSYHVEYHCTGNCQSHEHCDYSAGFRTEQGVLQGSLPRIAVQCAQSKIDGFAVDCGPYLRSEVANVVSAWGVTHTVRFRVWPLFADGIPDRTFGDHSYGCLPFVEYEQLHDGSTYKHLRDSAFAFSRDECHFDDDIVARDESAAIVEGE